MYFKMMEAIFMASNGHTGVLDSDFLHLEDAKESTNRLYSELGKVGIYSSDMPDSLHEALAVMESEYERQGFVNGMRMGARLMLECMGPAPLGTWDPYRRERKRSEAVQAAQ